MKIRSQETVGFASPGGENTKSDRGFTVLELLMVITIIAVVGSLLFPAVSRARILGRQTICRNNLHQLTTAQVLYAQDNEERIARESFEDNGVTLNLWGEVSHPRARDVWYNALPRTMGMREAQDFEPPSARADFYLPSQILQCPAARFPLRGAEDEVTSFSIAMNSKLIMRPFSTIKLSSILYPCDTVMFLDNRLPDEPPVDKEQATTELGQPSAYANRFVARHQGNGQLAFSDGHVQTLPGRVVVTNGLAFFPPVGVIWTADPSRNPNVD